MLPIQSRNNRAGGIKSNDAITSPRLRVLRETGENLGILNLEEAQRLAKEAGLDLVIVTESSDPPVAKIVSYDRFRYQKEKELKKQKQQKAPESKRIQISPREAEHDLGFKLKKLEEFLQAGHKIEVQMTLRGREKGMKDYAKGKMEDFLKKVETPFKQTQAISPGGRGLSTQIEPK
jgi:translation initiation factor IF-3